LRGDDANAAEPVAWRQTPRTSIGEPNGGISARQAPQPQVRATAAERYNSGDQQEAQIQALQAQIAELQRTAEMRAQQARDAAFREGENAGRTQATAEIQPLLQKLTQSIREVADLRPKLRHEAESDLLKLALAIARKVLHREITADPEALGGMIRVTLEKVRVQEIVRVRLHPQHHAPVQQHLTQIAGGSSIDLVPDARLALGGVVVETTRGDFDVSIDTQLREIERGLADRLKARA
jgi:flagellar assembly protein FliH